MVKIFTFDTSEEFRKTPVVEDRKKIIVKSLKYLMLKI